MPSTSSSHQATSSPSFQYRTYESMTEYLKYHQTKYPSLVRITSLGVKNGRNILSVEITSDVENSDENKADVALIAGLHNGDMIGKEVILMFLHHLTKKYEENDPRVKKLLSYTRLHLVPMVLTDHTNLSTVVNCTDQSTSTTPLQNLQFHQKVRIKMFFFSFFK